MKNDFNKYSPDGIPGQKRKNSIDWRARCGSQHIFVMGKFVEYTFPISPHYSSTDEQIADQYLMYENFLQQVRSWLTNGSILTMDELENIHYSIVQKYIKKTWIDPSCFLSTYNSQLILGSLIVGLLLWHFPFLPFGLVQMLGVSGVLEIIGLSFPWELLRNSFLVGPIAIFIWRYFCERKYFLNDKQIAEENMAMAKMAQSEPDHKRPALPPSSHIAQQKRVKQFKTQRASPNCRGLMANNQPIDSHTHPHDRHRHNQ